ACVVLHALVLGEQGHPAGDLRAETLLDVVEVGRRVLDGVVQDGGGEDREVVDAEDVADDEAHAEDVAVIRGDAVLAELAVVGAGGEGDRVEEALERRVRSVHRGRYPFSSARGPATWPTAGGVSFNRRTGSRASG